MTAAEPRMSAAAYRKGPGRPLERSTQIEILRWLRANVSSFTFHPHNAGLAYDATGGARQKAEGVLAGVSDLIGIVEAGPLVGHLFAVEVKRPGFTASEVRPSQVAFGHGVMNRCGLFIIAGSVSEVEAWARAAGIVRPRGWVAPWAEADEWGAL